MGIFNDLGKLGLDAARAIRNNKYEFSSERGVYIPGAQAFIGGAFRHALCPAGADEFGPWALDPNRVVTEGLVDILKVYFAGGTQKTAFYLAPYRGNVAPQASWTAANFATNATEFTGYTSSTRVQWSPTTPTTASVGNSANVSTSTITLNTAGDIYGMALIAGANAKSATTGTLVAASPFAAPRMNMASGDKLAIEYVLSAVDEDDA